MPRGKPRKKKIQIPPEGWGRCADCVAKNYETWCYYLNKAKTQRERSKFESIMMENEKIFDVYCRREKTDTTYKPEEHTCICCDYVKEYGKEVESGKEPVITSKTEFKSLCKDYMKKYKKVKRIPVTSRKSRVKIEQPKDEEDDD